MRSWTGIFMIVCAAHVFDAQAAQEAKALDFVRKWLEEDGGFQLLDQFGIPSLLDKVSSDSQEFEMAPEPVSNFPFYRWVSDYQQPQIVQAPKFEEWGGQMESKFGEPPSVLNGFLQEAAELVSAKPDSGSAEDDLSYGDDREIVPEVKERVFEDFEEESLKMQQFFQQPDYFRDYQTMEKLDPASGYQLSDPWQDFTWTIVERIEGKPVDEIWTISIIDMLPSDDTEAWVNSGEDLTVGDIYLLLEDPAPPKMGFFDPFIMPPCQMMAEMASSWVWMPGATSRDDLDVSELFGLLDEKSTKEYEKTRPGLRAFDAHALPASSTHLMGKSERIMRRLSFTHSALLGFCVFAVLSGVVFTMERVRRRTIRTWEREQFQLLHEPLIDDVEGANQGESGTESSS